MGSSTNWTVETEHWLPLRIVLRRHAVEQITERDLDPTWVERVALHPDWTEPDPKSGVVRHFGVVPERGGRRGAERHVLTAHLDRRARRP